VVWLRLLPVLLVLASLQPAAGQPPAAPATAQPPAPPAAAPAPQTPAPPASPVQQGIAWIVAHPVLGGIALWLVGFTALWGGLLLVYPTAFLPVLRLCASIGEFSVLGLKFKAIEPVVLLSFFAYRHRVLDRWIADHLAQASRSFAERDTVRERAVWVNVPVRVDDRPPATIGPADLRAIFHRPQFHVVIHGDGGTGKTSLACHIAEWAMAVDPKSRLRPHLMLPVFLESDFVSTGDEPIEQFAVLIREQLQTLTASTDELPPRFSAELCAAGRVLVVVDGLSERGAGVRTFLTQRAGTPPLRCVLFTSRTDERDVLRQVSPVRLHTVRLQGDDLWEFMRAYIDRVATVRFSERDLMDLCERLSDLAGDRDVTPMLATMYAGMAISRKSGDADPDRPRTIPGLMAEYVRQLAQRVGYR
jgi:hypothetical protein